MKQATAVMLALWCAAMIAFAHGKAASPWELPHAVQALDQQHEQTLFAGKADSDQDVLRRAMQGEVGAEPSAEVEHGENPAKEGEEGEESEHGEDEEGHEEGVEGEHGEEEGEEHEELNEDLVATTIAVIVLVLIFMTIAFEKAKHSIEHSADKNTRPVIESMFGELTVLGFLSIFTFCVTKLGYFEQLSVYLFGHEEEEALFEEFEFVHYFLFLIMVFFVTNVLVLVGEARSLEEMWYGMDRACLDRAYMEKLKAKWTSLASTSGGAGRKSKTLLSYICDCLFPFYFSSDRKLMKAIEDQLLFDGVRQEFILERSPKAPFEPAPLEHRVPEDFHFGRYLTVCLSQTLAHTVHVSEITWAFFAVLTLMLYALLEVIEDKVHIFAWTWVGLGWLVFFLSTSFDFHLQQIIGAHAARGGASATTYSTDQGEEVPLISQSPNLPAWCSIDLDLYMSKKRSCFSKCFSNGKHKVQVRSQDTLYMLEHSGPKLYNIIFQTKLVFMAAYLSMLLLTFLPTAWNSVGVTEFVVFAIVSIIPPVLMRSKGKISATYLAQASCIGVHSKPQIVSQVVREEKTSRIVRAFCVLQKLQQAVDEGFEDEPADESGNGHSQDAENAPAFAEARDWDALELAQVEKTFSAFDASGDGHIDTDELREVMLRMGLRLTDELLDRMVKILDTDSSGTISEQEFVRFYMNHVSITPKPGDDMDGHGHGSPHHQHELHERAHFFFNLFDRDGSGTISIHEFKTTMDAFEVGYTVDEVGELISELDVHGDGTISLHEFVELFKRHDKVVMMERANRLL